MVEGWREVGEKLTDRWRTTEAEKTEAESKKKA